MNNDLMFSSNTNEWATPQGFFDKLNEEFCFTLDPCCTYENHKCDTYYTLEDDGLSKSWEGHIVFCNPPYSVSEQPCKKNCTKKKCKTRGYHIEKYVAGQEDWIKKCYEENVNNGVTSVMLIPSRTDTKAFHEYIYNKPNVEIRFVKGRLKFGGCKDAAPFPSMVVVFK